MKMHPFMKRACIIILFTQLFFMWIPLSQEAPGEFLIDSYDGTVGADCYIMDKHPSPDKTSSYGQTFKSSASYKLTKAKMVIKRSSVPSTGYWKLYVYAHNGSYGNGTPIGEPLAESTNSIWYADLPQSWNFSEFEFDGTLILQANTPYCLVAYSLDGVFDAAKWCRAGADILMGHPGNGIYYSSGEWGVSVKEIFFYVYGENPDGAQQNISSNLQLAASLMIGLFIVVFVVHMIYMIERGSGEKFLDLLLGYVVCAIIICALAIFILSIGG